MTLEGKVAIVTGGGKGLGRAFCCELARAGADVAVLGRSLPPLEQTAAQVRASGRRALTLQLDVRQSHAVKAAIDKVVESWGQVDILVNNAGVAFRSPLISMSEEKIHEIVDLNLKGAIYGCQHVIPHMAKRRYGRIINISSTAGLHGTPAMSIYSATKYALIGLTHALAGELSHYNINVNAVCPGAVYTPGMEEHVQRTNPNADPKAAYQKIYEHHYFPREITAEEVAGVVTWLASDATRNITAHAIPVSGGAERKPVPAQPYFVV